MDIDGDVDIFAAGAITVVFSLLVAHGSGARLYGNDLSSIFKLCVRKLGMIICSGSVIPVSSICVVHRF